MDPHGATLRIQTIQWKYKHFEKFQAGSVNMLAIIIIKLFSLDNYNLIFHFQTCKGANRTYLNICIYKRNAGNWQKGSAPLREITDVGYNGTKLVIVLQFFLLLHVLLFFFLSSTCSTRMFWRLQHIKHLTEFGYCTNQKQKWPMEWKKLATPKPAFHLLTPAPQKYVIFRVESPSDVGYRSPGATRNYRTITVHFPET